MHRDHPGPDLLVAFVDGHLPREERNQLLAHLAECAVCRDYIAEISELPSNGRLREEKAVRLRPGRFVAQQGPAIAGGLAAALIILSLGTSLFRPSVSIDNQKQAAVLISGVGARERKANSSFLAVAPFHVSDERTVLDSRRILGSERMVQTSARPRNLVPKTAFPEVSARMSRSNSLTDRRVTPFLNFWMRSKLTTPIEASGLHQIALKTQFGEKWIDLDPALFATDTR